jgi:hypothetical protein
MNNNLKTFFIVLFVVLVVSGGLIFLAAKNNSKVADSQKTDAGQSTGEVAGASTNAASDYSNSYLEKLAKFMTEKGMVLYGAYWCSHCKEQKAEFGDALKHIDYVECDPKGENANPDECVANNIKAYPTWIYNGQKVDSNGDLVPISTDGGTGTLSISELARIVGFTEAENEQP